MSNFRLSTESFGNGYATFELKAIFVLYFINQKAYIFIL